MKFILRYKMLGSWYETGEMDMPAVRVKRAELESEGATNIKLIVVKS